MLRYCRNPYSYHQSKHLIAAIRRIIHVSVETGRIVTGLPEPITTELDIH